MPPIRTKGTSAASSEEGRDGLCILLTYNKRTVLAELPSSHEETLDRARAVFEVPPSSRISISKTWKNTLRKVELHRSAFHTLKDGDELFVTITASALIHDSRGNTHLLRDPVTNERLLNPFVSKARAPLTNEDMQSSVDGLIRSPHTIKAGPREGLGESTISQQVRATPQSPRVTSLTVSESSPCALASELADGLNVVQWEGSDGHQSTHLFKVRRTSTFGKVKAAMASLLDRCVDDLSLLYDGRRVSSDDTMDSLDMKDEGELLDLYFVQTGGKPVIYLQPPRPITGATVTLSLCAEWQFSATYPVRAPRKTEDGGSTISWTVDADATSELTDQATGRKLAYLFWEAQSLPPRSPAAAVAAAAFSPAAPSLTPANAALLPFDAFLAHLDTALSALGLHVAARTDFVTYWLPAFVRIRERGRRVAFRFLPQAEYARAAPLAVVPAPDVVTRVFLLFGGVAAGTSAEWAGAAARAHDVDWKTIVGVTDGAFDETRFRVLEWGGMEVHL